MCLTLGRSLLCGMGMPLAVESRGKQAGRLAAKMLGEGQWLSGKFRFVGPKPASRPVLATLSTK